MNIRLSWNFLTDWQSSGGQEAGAYADQLCIKDSHQLPYLPGKSIKGLLRDAFSTAMHNQWFADMPSNLLALLFGDEGRNGLESQGLLQFSNAHLPAAERAYLAQQTGLSRHLFRVLHATAINPDTGVAQSSSLRAIEVAVPMLLHSDISINTHHPHLAAIPDWQQRLPACIDAVLPLIDAAGSKKQRGLGLVEVNRLAGD